MKTSRSKETTKSLDHRLELELARTERIRLIIFLIIMFASFAGAVVDSILISDQIKNVFKDVTEFYKIIFAAQVLVVELVIALVYVSRCIKREKGVSFAYKLITTIFESTLPGLLLLLLISRLEIPVLIDSPVVFIYIPILIISILHLDYRLTFLSGIIIAIMYTICITVAMGLNDNSELQILLPFATYYVRSSMFVLATFCAAYVANRLRKRLESALRYQDQRNIMQQLFSQQVSPQVVDALVSDKNISGKQNVSILFLDIRGFTDFAQNKQPEEVIEFQNRFFSPIIDIINKYNGVTNQILGDGLMATFGAPVKIEKHEEVAFRAAKDIFEQVRKDHEVEIRMGLHNGEVVTGNIGNESRKQFSVSGTAVIIASRLEQLNKEYDSKMLVSKNYFDEIASTVQDWSNIGKHRLKGIDKEIEIIKIL